MAVPILCFQKFSHGNNSTFFPKSTMSSIIGVAASSSLIRFNPRKIEASSTPEIFCLSELPKKIELTRSRTRVVRDGSNRITSAICPTKLWSDANNSFKVLFILLREASCGHWFILSIKRKLESFLVGD